jgi:phage shock protein C
MLDPMNEYPNITGPNSIDPTIADPTINLAAGLGASSVASTPSMPAAPLPPATPFLGLTDPIPSRPTGGAGSIDPGATDDPTTANDPIAPTAGFTPPPPPPSSDYTFGPILGGFLGGPTGPTGPSASDASPHPRYQFLRSRSDKRFAGICGAIGRDLNVDTWIVRLLVLLFMFLTGVGFLLYIAIAFIVPKVPEGTIEVRSNRTFGDGNWDGKQILGAALLAIGVLTLLDRLDIGFSSGISLPLLLMGGGGYALWHRRESLLKK